MRHGSLFSGIGGFDLAAEWMGWENVFHCEWNPFGQRVLHHYWPQAETFTDITKTDFTKYYGTVDIISGGFPCQPYSSAGKRLGKEDERHLWPEMLRAIREIAPRFVVGENVRGLTNWNGGLVFDEVCAELENLGYQVAPVIIPACGVGAPHRRERVWFVAYSDSNARRCRPSESGREERETNSDGKPQIYTRAHTDGKEGAAADAYGSAKRPPRTSGETESKRGNGHLFSEQRGESSELNSRLYEFSRDASDAERSGGLQRGKNIQSQKSNGQQFVGHGWKRDATDASSGGVQGHGGRCENGEFQTNEFNANNRKRQPRMDWQKFPTQSPICSGDDGLSRELDGITFSKWRNESIKAYGNAIVPQVAYEIFKAITKTI
jgi:DNA (cytosine-5)-methyltransferase 1